MLLLQTFIINKNIWHSMPSRFGQCCRKSKKFYSPRGPPTSKKIFPKITTPQSPPFSTLKVLVNTFGFASVGTIVAYGSAAYCCKLQSSRPNDFSKWMDRVFFRTFGRLYQASDIYYVLLAANCAVFLAWRLPFLRHIMNEWFLTSPFQSHPYATIVTSMFSHQSVIHLFLNMYVLHSISGHLAYFYQTPLFLALYVSGGLWGGWLSHTVKLLRKTNMPSLGASGAIVACMATFCLLVPEARLSIVGLDLIVPHSLNGMQVMMGMALFESCGILFRWRLFDHAAHLGGILFGVFQGFIVNPVIALFNRKFNRRKN